MVDGAAFEQLEGLEDAQLERSPLELGALSVVFEFAMDELAGMDRQTPFRGIFAQASRPKHRHEAMELDLFRSTRLASPQP
jgi:hypothetical protein